MRYRRRLCRCMMARKASPSRTRARSTSSASLKLVYDACSARRWIMDDLTYCRSMIPRVEPEGMLFRKPVSTPDQVRGRLFRDHARVAEKLKVPYGSHELATPRERRGTFKATA